MVEASGGYWQLLNQSSYGREYGWRGAMYCYVISGGTSSANVAACVESIADSSADDCPNDTRLIAKELLFRQKAGHHRGVAAVGWLLLTVGRGPPILTSLEFPLWSFPSGVSLWSLPSQVSPLKSPSEA